MEEKYELIYGYMHCKNETVISAGFANSEEEAAAWVSAMNENQNGFIPEKDPACECEVSFCPMKFQRPWFSYRKVQKGVF
jgi:hypothetical protein